MNAKSSIRYEPDYVSEAQLMKLFETHSYQFVGFMPSNWRFIVLFFWFIQDGFSLDWKIGGKHESS